VIGGRFVRGLWILALSFALLCSSAWADPASELAKAESHRAGAEADVAAAQQQLDVARADYSAASRRARPAARSARAARAEARSLRSRLVDRQRRARAEIATAERTQRQAEDDHDDEMAVALGAGLAALIAAAIALAWGWFRATPAVAALIRMRVGQAIALCLGGGFLVIVVGAALGAGGGLLGAFGMFVFCLGFVLPAALLAGRHSAQVQRRRSKPVFGQERLPSWVSRSAAALLALFSIGALGVSILGEEPAPAAVSERLLDDADALASGEGSRRLSKAVTEADLARSQASGPLAQLSAARADVRMATRALGATERWLAAAEVDESRHARRLAAATRREEREFEVQVEREAEEAEEVEAEETSSSGCDPGYSGCVPPYPPDVDCAEVGGPVSVSGSDPHGLDADGDGVGCE
jgi:hypothetical protein